MINRSDPFKTNALDFSCDPQLHFLRDGFGQRLPCATRSATRAPRRGYLLDEHDSLVSRPIVPDRRAGLGHGKIHLLLGSGERNITWLQGSWRYSNFWSITIQKDFTCWAQSNTNNYCQ
jgi:hypothetical protein